MFQWTTNYQFSAPSGVSGVAVTPSGVAWANSPWVEIHPGTEVDWLLTCVVLCNRGTTADFEVDIGVVPISGVISGAVTISTLKGMVDVLATYSHGVMPLPVAVDKMPAGRRVGVRMRKSGTNTSQWSWAIQFLKKPVNGNFQTTSGTMKVLPSAAAPITLSAAASAWVWGPWVQITSGAPANLAVASLGLSQPFTGVDFEVQLGKGPSGSESPVLTLKGYEAQTVVVPGYYPFPNPVSGIAAGNRVAARFRKEGTNTTGPDIHFSYYELPL